MNIIYKLPFPDEVCSKILLYACKSSHIHLQEEIFKRELSKYSIREPLHINQPRTIYQKLVEKGGIVKDERGHVTELCVYDKNWTALLDSAERNSLNFDISILKSLPNLTFLDLRNTDVYGDIVVIRSLPKLTQFYLNSSGIKGDIQALHVLQNLTEFRLNNTDVTGDIQVFQKIQNLAEFDLYDTDVFGDIQVLHGLPNLTKIFLFGTGVTGNKEVFKNYRKIHRLKECCCFIN